MATMTCKSKTPSTFGKKNKTASRSYIAVQNFMEGDEFVMRGEPNRPVATTDHLVQRSPYPHQTRISFHYERTTR